MRGRAGSRLWITTAPPRVSHSSPLGAGGRVKEEARGPWTPKCQKNKIETARIMHHAPTCRAGQERVPTTSWPDASKQMQNHSRESFDYVHSKVCIYICALPSPPAQGGLPRPLMSARALCAHTDNVSPAGAHIFIFLVAKVVSEFLLIYSRVTGPRARQDPGSG